MFKRSFRSSDRVEKHGSSGIGHGRGSTSGGVFGFGGSSVSTGRLRKKSSLSTSMSMSKDHAKWAKVQKSFEQGSSPSSLTSPITTIAVGREGRLFAAHEDVLSLSPYFAAVMREHALAGRVKRIDLPHEEPEVLSSILEYLYKGDYYPCLVHNKRKSSWELESAVGSPNPENPGGRGPSSEATIYMSGANPSEPLLKDTVIYCAAQHYGLDELQRLALKKQGLHSGIEVGTILRSARYAYDHTPDSDSRLRAHYLALIIRCRRTFKRSGTMQAEMERGGRLFFDLFVALCNHVDDLVAVGNAASPRTI